MTPVAYKLVPHPSQMRLAQPDAPITARAPFTQHHIWVTKYKDGELFPGGFYTNQSNGRAGGVGDWVARKDNVENTDLVLWHTFALTHVPRVEDFPVMPVETHTISLKPSTYSLIKRSHSRLTSVFRQLLHIKSWYGCTHVFAGVQQESGCRC